MAGGKGRAPNAQKQALPPPKHMTLRPFGQLSSDGLMVAAESCRESQSQEKLALPPLLSVRHGQHVPTQLRRPRTQGRGAPHSCGQSAGDSTRSHGDTSSLLGVLLFWVTLRLLSNSPAQRLAPLLPAGTTCQLPPEQVPKPGIASTGRTFPCTGLSYDCNGLFTVQFGKKKH